MAVAFKDCASCKGTATPCDTCDTYSAYRRHARARTVHMREPVTSVTASGNGWIGRHCCAKTNRLNNDCSLTLTQTESRPPLVRVGSAGDAATGRHFIAAIENPAVAVRPRDFGSESTRKYVTKGNLLIHWGMYAKGRASNGFGYWLDDLGGLFRRQGQGAAASADRS